jgi:acetyl/propionyl-CoA carboxylase alpha subunit
MLRAITGCAAMGLTTNLGLLAAIVEDEDVKAGRFHTRFIDGHLQTLTIEATSSAAGACALAVEAWYSQSGGTSSGPWGAGSLLMDRAALLPCAPLGVSSYWEDSKVQMCEIVTLDAGHITVRSGEQAEPLIWDVTMSQKDGIFGGTVNGRDWWALDRGDVLEMQIQGWHRKLRRAAPIARTVGESNQAVAPMHGIVVALNVKAGDDVAEGDTLVVLEAMKMENQVRAPRAGQVAQISCEIGASVSVGQVLVELSPVEGQPTNDSPYNKSFA